MSAPITNQGKRRAQVFLDSMEALAVNPDHHSGFTCILVEQFERERFPRAARPGLAEAYQIFSPEVGAVAWGVEGRMDVLRHDGVEYSGYEVYRNTCRAQAPEWRLTALAFAAAMAEAGDL